MTPLRLAAAALAMFALVPSWAEDLVESSTARYQSTLSWQQHPAFASAYQGPNSLTGGADRMHTFTLTAHWGARLAPTTELYINPELAAGVPFSQELLGLGGFTNGEITRATGARPKPYLQRLFLRHTWNQGGGSEVVESDFNQMAGRVDRNRTVLTVGNFSLLDVFDDNAYAKDPRKQFMNWGAWTYAAWDYAADARGFGWGLALEVVRGDWAFRLARMTLPKEPNGLALDFQLNKHYGDQIEIEHAHQWAGWPGTVRALAYRNRAVLADYNDATAYLLARQPLDRQTILKVRYGEKFKQGWGLSLEQALGAELGVFMRAMNSDGQTETVAFTEVDRSRALGMTIKGLRWSREQDTVGLVLMNNELSAQRRRYLEAGGISFFIGDGRLNYKPENILEAFYSCNISKGLWLTGDYQHIRNPAYNASRGPVQVYTVRAHAEF